MSDTVITVENLSKRYLLGHEGQQDGYSSLRETVVKYGKNFARKTFDVVRGRQIVQGDVIEDFWALKDVSFEVKRGDVLGIIGRNGAGKSTLLKILSRITDPTEGRVTLNGRVASLLEVGTGFHPELTGRENVFLNGAILGMSRTEIKNKFDEIVDFAGVEKFLDTPVKRYSSGMYVRLAFAVAAHLEPEILIVDEVLAVGDMEFQKKCLGKMQDISKGGRTVLFVSHNIAAINKLCSSALLLSEGRLVQSGVTNEVLENYLNFGAQEVSEVNWPEPNEAPGNDRVRLRSVRVTSKGVPTADVMLNEECQIEIDYRVEKPGQRLSASIHLISETGVEVLATANFSSSNLIIDRWSGKQFPVGLYRSICVIPANFLNEGHYYIRVALVSDNKQVELLTEEIIGFRTHDSGEMRKEYTGHWLGVVRPKFAWQTNELILNDL